MFCVPKVEGGGCRKHPPFRLLHAEFVFPRFHCLLGIKLSLGPVIFAKPLLPLGVLLPLFCALLALGLLPLALGLLPFSVLLPLYCFPFAPRLIFQLFPVLL